MNLLDIIEKDLPTLSLSDTLEDAAQIMSDINVEYLPLLNNEEQFIALVSLNYVEETLIHKKKTTFAALHDLMHLKKAVILDMHPYDVAKYLLEHKINIVPILDREEIYQGIIHKEDLLDFFVSQSGIMLPGAVISLKIPQNEFILSNIIRICENNDIYVLHVQVKQLLHAGATDSLEVILKTNSTDLRALKTAFQRYDYQVLYTSGTAEEKDDLDKRYQLLMNYINM